MNAAQMAQINISIHALRVEGDGIGAYMAQGIGISIHALRVEGDLPLTDAEKRAYAFLSTPSGWRATGGKV